MVYFLSCFFGGVCDYGVFWRWLCGGGFWFVVVGGIMNNAGKGGSFRRLRLAATYSSTCVVPSAWTGLTALFGMVRGGTPSLWLPECV